MPLFIDLPALEIDSLDSVVAGWVAGDENVKQLVIHVDGKIIPHFDIMRPDVEAAFPQFPYTCGFGANFDILDIAHSEFPIIVQYGDEMITKSVTLSRRALSDKFRELALLNESRKWCQERVLCPSCKCQDNSSKIQSLSLCCEKCGHNFRIFENKFDFLPDEMRFALSPSPATTSANPYDPAALDLINRVTNRGGVVLDCGAGSRHRRMRNVINLEIVAYRSTDVLGVGEALPFKNDSFDAILSLAVLEHVRDPFACAKELARVLKPGGQIMCSVPFLQPEHNFPGHFYNMTQAGLQNLFSGNLALVSSDVPPHGHPIFAVQWILKDYLDGLPLDVRKLFSNMTIGEIASHSAASQLGSPIASALSAECMRKIACLNTLVFEKTF